MVLTKFLKVFDLFIVFYQTLIDLESNLHCYCTHAITTRFETALNYNPWILDPEIEEFPCLVYKLSVILTAPDYNLH